MPESPLAFLSISMSRASCVTRHAHPDPSHAHGVACVGLRHPENVSAIADMDKRVHKVPKGETVLRLELTAYTHTQLWSSFKCAHTLLWSGEESLRGIAHHSTRDPDERALPQVGSTLPLALTLALALALALTPNPNQGRADDVLLDVVQCPHHGLGRRRVGPRDFRRYRD